MSILQKSTHDSKNMKLIFSLLVSQVPCVGITLWWRKERKTPSILLQLAHVNFHSPSFCHLYTHCHASHTDMAFIWRVQHPCPCWNQPLCLSAVTPHTHPLPPLQNPTRPNYQLADIASLELVMNKRGEKQVASIWKQRRRTCSTWGCWSMISPVVRRPSLSKTR